MPRYVARTALSILSLALTLSLLARPVPAGDAAKGKMLYASRCSFCHGVSGKGDGPAGAALKPPPTNFASAAYWKSASLQAVKDAILNGKPNSAMVPFKSALKAEDIEDLVAYLQTFSPAQGQ